jgi:hypothetical protein
MNKRTFILSLASKDKDYIEPDDVINILSIRAAEAFIETNQCAEVSLEFLSSLKKFITDNVVKDKSLLRYSVDIDFDADVAQ